MTSYPNAICVPLLQPIFVFVLKNMPELCMAPSVAPSVRLSLCPQPERSKEVAYHLASQQQKRR